MLHHRLSRDSSSVLLIIVLLEVAMAMFVSKSFAATTEQGSAPAPIFPTKALSAPGVNLIAQPLRSEYLQLYSVFQDIYAATLREQSKAALGLSAETDVEALEKRYRAWRKDVSRWAELNKVRLLWMQCVDCPLFHPIVVGAEGRAP